MTKRNSEQREMAPVRTAFTSSTVQLPSRKTWTNNLNTQQRETRIKIIIAIEIIGNPEYRETGNHKLGMPN